MSLTLSEILFEINRATLGDQQRFNNLVFTPKRHCYHEKRIEKKNPQEPVARLVHKIGIICRFYLCVPG